MKRLLWSVIRLYSILVPQRRLLSRVPVLHAMLTHVPGVRSEIRTRKIEFGEPKCRIGYRESHSIPPLRCRNGCENLPERSIHARW